MVANHISFLSKSKVRKVKCYINGQNHFAWTETHPVKKVPEWRLYFANENNLLSNILGIVICTSCFAAMNIVSGHAACLDQEAAFQREAQASRQ